MSYEDMPVLHEYALVSYEEGAGVLHVYSDNFWSKEFRKQRLNFWRIYLQYQMICFQIFDWVICNQIIQSKDLPSNSLIKGLTSKPFTKGFTLKPLIEGYTSRPLMKGFTQKIFN